MEKIVGEVGTIVVGTALIIFRRQFVQLVVAFQEQVLNIQQDTEKLKKTGKLTVPIFGLFLILMGAWNLAIILY